ncbi:MAG TPA: hypothetical protein VFU71_11360 [Burkholderiaceae bacterium]|nr:hypothetical protein [Burkholderiaceae bacterium]
MQQTMASRCRRLVRSGGKRLAPATDAEHELIASLDIRLDDGADRCRGFRYASVSDAVSYARRKPPGDED